MSSAHVVRGPCSIWQVFNVEGDFNDLVDSLRRLQLRATVTPASPSVRAFYLQTLSDFAAAGTISGLQYQRLLQLLRASDPALSTVFDQFKTHGDKSLLRDGLLHCLPEDAALLASEDDIKDEPSELLSLSVNHGDGCASMQRFRCADPLMLCVQALAAPRPVLSKSF